MNIRNNVQLSDSLREKLGHLRHYRSRIVRKYKTPSFLLTILFTGLIFSGLFGMAEGESELTGKVIDQESGIEIYMAEVLIKGTNISATTNSNGEFRITGLHEQDYTLRIEKPGFYSIETVTDLSRDDKIVVHLDRQNQHHFP